VEVVLVLCASGVPFARAVSSALAMELSLAQQLCLVQNPSHNQMVLLSKQVCSWVVVCWVVELLNCKHPQVCLMAAVEAVVQGVVLTLVVVASHCQPLEPALQDSEP